MDIKFIYFDVGGVLFKFLSGLQKLAEKTGLPYAECEKIWKELDDSVCKGEIAPQEIWNSIKKKSGYGGDDINFVDFWVNQFMLIKETHEFIKTYSKIYSIGLISNIYPGVYPLALEREKIPNIFYAQLIFSCNLGIAKPNPAIYEIAERRTAIPPKEILYVDDFADYIIPAKQKGWNTFLFNTENPSASVNELKTLLS